MTNTLGVYTLSDFVHDIAGNVRLSIPEDERSTDYEAGDPTVVPRTMSVHQFVAEEILRCTNVSAPEERARLANATIAGVLEDLMLRQGVELRHPEVWFCYSIEIVYAQVLEMNRRNLQMRT